MASSNISDPLLSGVLSHYPLKKPKMLGLIEASKRNHNFIIEDGSGNRYVLRHYRRNLQADRVRFQLEFQQHLASAGFPTSKIIKTIANDIVQIEAEAP